MTTYTFPPLIPNYVRELGLPDFGVQVFQFDDGSESRRYSHSTGNHTKLKLEYMGLTSQQVATLTEFYKQVKGLSLAFKLPDDLIQHPVGYVQAIEDLGDTTLWRFEQPLKFQTLFSNIYSGDVYLISVIE